MNHFNLFIRRIVTDHHTVMFIGIMLILMGCISLSEHLFKSVLGLEFQLAYGFIFMGIFNVLMAVAFIIMGTRNIEMSLEKPGEDPLAALSKRIEELERKICNMGTGR